MKRQPFFVNDIPAGPATPRIKSRAAASLLLGAALTGGMLLAGTGQAQVVTFNTTGFNSTAATFNATQQDPGVNGTPALSRVGLTATARTGSFTSSANLITANTPDFSQKYVTFSLTPTSGNVLFATGITFSVSGSGTASNQYAIGYSTDGFATAITSTGAVTATDTTQSFTNFTSLITNNTVEVRTQNYGTTSVSGGAPATGGTFRFGFTNMPIQVTGATAATTGNIALAASANTEVRTSTSLTLSGVISGNFSSITKTGAGTVILTGQNTLGSSNGTSIFVNAGTLLANNNPAGGSFAGPGNVQVNAGGTLGGSGSTVGAVTVANGGTLAPGAAAGAAGTFALGALTLNDTSNLVFDLGGDGVGDTMNIGTALTLDGKLTINALSGFGAGQYQLFSYSGSFTDNTLDVTSAPAGYNYSINTSTPNFVYLNVTPVPEPATVLGGLMMVGALGWNQRRRLRGWMTSPKPLAGVRA